MSQKNQKLGFLRVLEDPSCFYHQCSQNLHEKEDDGHQSLGFMVTPLTSNVLHTIKKVRKSALSKVRLSYPIFKSVKLNSYRKFGMRKKIKSLFQKNQPPLFN